jgi:hypothetical protein
MTIKDKSQQSEQNNKKYSRRNVMLSAIPSITIGAALGKTLTHRAWETIRTSPLPDMNAISPPNRYFAHNESRLITINDSVVGSPVYSHNVLGEYNSAKKKTYLTFRDEKDEVNVMYYDHACDSYSSVYKAAIYPFPEDTHGEPSLTVDNDGYIHVFYGSHATPLQYAKSVNKHDITNWQYQGATLPDELAWQESIDEAEGLSENCNIGKMPNGTYPIPATRNNNLYVFYRTARENYRAHGSLDNESVSEDPSGRTFYPDHEYATIIRSFNGGRTWGDVGPVIDASGFIGETESQTSDYFSSSYTGADVYINDFDLGPDGDYFHLTWIIAVGEDSSNPHNGLRKNVYHAKWDPDTATFYNLNGTDYGDTINRHNHKNSYIKIFAGLFTGTASHYIHTNGDVYIITKSYDGDDDEIKWYYSQYVNGSLSKGKRIGTALSDHTGHDGTIRINSSSNLEAHIITGGGNYVCSSSSKSPNTSKGCDGKGGPYRKFELTGGSWDMEVIAANNHNNSQGAGTREIRNSTDEFPVIASEHSGTKIWQYRESSSSDSC